MITRKKGKGKLPIFCDNVGWVISIYVTHMGEATVYRAFAEAQSWFNNDFGYKVDELVTGCRSKCVITMHDFPPLH